MGLGKFLSLWNSTTGQPISFPLATPYTYTTWDYFIIEVVSSATPPVNYRPDGSSYTGTASSVAETDEIEIWDVYVYDWQTWLLQSNHGKTVAFANIAGQPTDNTALANALNDKQGVLTAWTNIDITNNVISAEGLTILSYGNSTWNDFITAYNRWWLVYCRASSNSNPASWTQGRMAFMAYLNNPTTPTEVEFQYYRSRSDHNTAANQLDQVFVYKLTSASWWTWTVTERNTWAKAVAWTWISLWWGSGNMTISADTTVLATQTDLNSKQDTLVSWTNIKSINWNSLLWSGNITIDESSFKVFTVTDLDDSTQCYEVYSRVRDGKPAAVIYGSHVFYYTGTYVRLWETKYYFHTLYGYGETIFELVLEANAQLYRWDEPTEVNLGWAEIEYVTQAEYNALPSSKLTDNKHYFIYEESWWWWGWQPWTDTIAYYIFSDNLNDGSGNGYDLTAQSAAYSYTTWVSGDCCSTTWWFWASSTLTDSIFAWNFTLMFFIKLSKVPSLIRMMWCTWDYTNIQYESWQGGLQWYNHNSSWRTTWTWTPTANTWQHIAITWDGTGYTAYLDWVTMTKTKRGTVSQWWNNFYLFTNNSSTSNMAGSFDEVIIESKVWTQQEIQDYLANFTY